MSERGLSSVTPTQVIRDALTFKPHWHGQKEACVAALAALDELEAERDERLTKESGLALIADSHDRRSPYERGYADAMDDKAAASATGDFGADPKPAAGGVGTKQ